MVFELLNCTIRQTLHIVENSTGTWAKIFFYLECDLSR